MSVETVICMCDALKLIEVYIAYIVFHKECCSILFDLN